MDNRDLKLLDDIFGDIYQREPVQETERVENIYDAVGDQRLVDLALNNYADPQMIVTEDHNMPVMMPESPTGALPSIDDYPGAYNFNLSVQPNEAERNAWTYSSQVGMLFIDMEKTALINFHIDYVSPEFRIRALLVYADSGQRHVPVVRCPRHRHGEDPKDESHKDEECHCSKFNHVGHVLKTKRPDASYEYNPGSGRHSVVINMGVPHPGTGYITVPYTFSCMNTCIAGINRRQLYLVFTLEDQSQQVLGRAKLPVKICKCPKRDRERMEAERGAPPGKKVKKTPKIKYELVETESEPPCPSCGQANENNERFERIERSLQEVKNLSERNERSLQEVKNLLLELTQKFERRM